MYLFTSFNVNKKIICTTSSVCILYLAEILSTASSGVCGRPDFSWHKNTQLSQTALQILQEGDPFLISFESSVKN